MEESQVGARKKAKVSRSKTENKHNATLTRPPCALFNKRVKDEFSSKRAQVDSGRRGQTDRPANTGLEFSSIIRFRKH
jgi:hypothetical protein